MKIVITGASAGIGFESARRFAAEGHEVYAIARRRHMLEKLSSGSVHVIAGDLSDESFIDAAAAEISADKKPLNILINNAGLLINKPFEKLTPQDWQQVYGTNVFALVNLTRKLLPFFAAQGPNHIVNISSMGGFQGSMKFKGLSAYSSSKAAVAAITECLAEEFKDKNIPVNCLCLGSVQTEMFADAFPEFKAALSAEDAAKFVCGFAQEGWSLFNGKIIPVSSTTP